MNRSSTIEGVVVFLNDSIPNIKFSLEYSVNNKNEIYEQLMSSLFYFDKLDTSHLLRNTCQQITLLI